MWRSGLWLALAFVAASVGLGAAPGAAPGADAPTYRRASLKGLSDEEIVCYMGPGRRWQGEGSEPRIPLVIPDGFWILPPREAALGLADANRTPEHRVAYKLTVADGDAYGPPEVCTISVFHATGDPLVTLFSYYCSYTIRCDPNGSYFVYFRFVRAWPILDIRFCPLRYDKARHLAQTILWLGQVRSQGGPTERSMLPFESFTGADYYLSSGTLDVTGPDGRQFAAWHGYVLGERLPALWKRDYSESIRLSLADIAATVALPQHLGERWSKWDLDDESPWTRARSATPQQRQAQVARFVAAAPEVLERFHADGSGVSADLVNAIAWAAAQEGTVELAPQLARIRDSLPPPSDAERRYAKAEAGEQANGTEPQASASEEEEEARLIGTRGVTISDAERDRYYVRQGLAAALDKLSSAADPDALERRAEAGDGWAGAILSRLHPDRCVRVLDHQLQGGSPGMAGSLFFWLEEYHPDVARKFAASRPADEVGPLTVEFFKLLAAEGKVADEEVRVRALVRILRNTIPGVDDGGQLEAIGLLVPPEDPMRYADKGIDDALLALIKAPRTGGPLDGCLLAAACQALAQRTGVAHFDEIAATLGRYDQPLYYGEAVGALALAAGSCTKEQRARLSDAIAAHLGELYRDNLVLCAWAAGLQDLRPRLEEIATTGPEQPEAAPDQPRRSHMARRVLAVWDEEDPLTRIKLLVALGLQESAAVTDLPVVAEHVKDELLRARRALPPEQAKAALRFLDWCEHERLPSARTPWSTDWAGQFAALARSALQP